MINENKSNLQIQKSHFWAGDVKSFFRLKYIDSSNLKQNGRELFILLLIIIIIVLISIVRDYIFTFAENEKLLSNLEIPNVKNFIIVNNSTTSSTSSSLASIFSSTSTISTTTTIDSTSTTSTTITTTTTITTATTTTTNWDSYNFTSIKTLQGHRDLVSCLLLLKNGDLMSGDWKNDLLVWDPDENFSLKKEKKNGNSWYGVSAIEEIDNGNLLVGSGDKTIKKYTSAYRIINTIESLKYVVYSMLYINETQLVIGATEGVFYIINTDDLNPQFYFTGDGHNKTINRIVLLSNGDLATASEDKTIKIWSLKTKSFKFQLEGHNGSVLAIVQIKNGDLASGSSDSSIIVWDLFKKSKKYVLYQHTNVVSCLIELENGDLVSGSWDKSIIIWNLNTKQIKQILIEHTDKVFSLVILKNGDFASGAWDHTIKIWSRRLK